MKDITLNYITVQGWMVTKLKLSSNDLLVFSLIYGFCQDNETEFKGSVNYICNWLNCTRPTASKALNNLCEKQLLIKTQFIVNSVLFNTYKINLEAVKKLYDGSKETLQGGSKETLQGGSKETLHNNTILYNNNLDINNNNTALLKNFSFFNSLINYGFEKNLVSDWIKVRKTKKATNTETAFKNFISEIEKRNCNLNEILEFIIVRNWSGFKWTWYDAEKEKEKSSAKKEKENEPIVIGRQTMATVQKNMDMTGVINPFLKND